MSLSTNYKFKITVLTGIVNKVDKTVKTHVSSIGGGGWVGPNGGYVEAPRTGSSNSIDHDIWYSVDGESKERLLQFTTYGSGIAIRENQKISVFTINNENIGKSYNNFALYNHDIEEMEWIHPDDHNRDCNIQPDISILKSPLMQVAMVAIPILIGMMPSNTEEGWAIGLLSFAMTFYFLGTLHENVQSALNIGFYKNSRALNNKIKENIEHVVKKISAGSKDVESAISFDYDWQRLNFWEATWRGGWEGVAKVTRGPAKWLAYLLTPLITGAILYVPVVTLQEFFRPLYSILVFFQIPILTWIILTFYLWRKLYRSTH